MCAVACALLAAACGKDPTDGDSQLTIEVTPPSLTLRTGESRGLSVRVVVRTGAALGARVFWSSERPSVATVSQVGVVTGIAPGSTNLAASVGGRSTLVPVTVTEFPVTLVRLSPAAAEVRVGSTVTLQGEAFQSDGAVVQGRAFAWTSSNPAVASVSSDGVVTGVAPGSVTIAASVDGVSGTAMVTVQPAPVASLSITPSSGALLVGQSLQLTAMIRDAAGAPLAGYATAWSSSAPAVATVSSTGLVTALTAGRATITATSEGKSSSASITVSLVPVNSVSIIPPTVTLSLGKTAQLFAQPLDSAGAVLNGRTVTWSSDQPDIATVSSGGLVTALADGQARITAVAEGKSGSASINVTPTPVASIDVSPTTASMRVGATQQLTATPRDAQGAALANRFVSWVSGGPTVATVDQRGLVTAVGVGTALIVATSEEQRATVTVTVTPVTVAAVVVSPSIGTLTPGRTLQLNAAIVDDRAVPIPGKIATWSSSVSAVATVSSAGLVTAVAVGTTRITATSDGISGFATLTITPVPVAAVMITPTSSSLNPGQTVQLAASARDANGNTITGRTTTWSSSATSVATVTANGLVTGVAAGSAQITATVDGVAGVAAVTVATPPVAAVNVSPTTGTLAVGATLQLSVAIVDATGTPVPGKVATWSSSAATVATVSAGGLVTGLLAGNARITASSDGVTGSADLTITAVPVASVTIAPGAATLSAGQTVQLVVTARDANGAVLTGRPTTWSSSASSVATVSSGGLVTAVSPGSSQITGTVEGVSASAVISVAAAAAVSVTLTPDPVTVVEGSAATVTATVRDAQGAVITGATLSFSVADVSVASVSTTGVVTGVRAGTTTITASAAVPGQSTPATGSVSLTVTSAPLGRVDISAPGGTIHIGSIYARSVSAQAFDANNNPISGAQIAWSSGKSGLSVSGSGSSATITASGVPTAGLTVIATLPGKTPVADTVAIDSDLIPIATFDVTPPTATLFPLQSQQLNATLKDSAGNVIGSSSGNPLGNRTVAWSLKSGLAILAPNSGMVTTVTAILPGSLVVMATVGSQTATSSITVTVSATVDTIAAQSGSSPTINISAGAGQNSKEKFLVLSTAGNPIPGQSFSVASSNPSVATAAPHGSTSTDRKGEGEFSVTLTASAKKGDTADVSVSAGGKRTVWKLTVK
ncbi:MAG: beta strand repeat-containing protein [Gemmatimonadaceae bacterium]